MKYRKIKYFLKSQASLSDIKSYIKKIKNCEFNQASPNYNGQIFSTDNTFIFKDITIISFRKDSHNIFETSHHNDNSSKNTHNFNVWRYIYIMMDDGTEFTDFENNKNATTITTEFYNYCMYGILPDDLSNSEFIDIDNIIL